MLKALFAHRGQIVLRRTLFDDVRGDHDERIAIRTCSRRGYLLKLIADANPSEVHPAVLPMMALLPFASVGVQCGRIVAHGLSEDLRLLPVRHTASHQVWFAIVNSLFGSPPKRFRTDYRVIPRAAFTDPAVVRVELDETEARGQGLPHGIEIPGTIHI